MAGVETQALPAGVRLSSIGGRLSIYNRTSHIHLKSLSSMTCHSPDVKLKLPSNQTSKMQCKHPGSPATPYRWGVYGTRLSHRIRSAITHLTSYTFNPMHTSNETLAALHSPPLPTVPKLLSGELRCTQSWRAVNLTLRGRYEDWDLIPCGPGGGDGRPQCFLMLPRGMHHFAIGIDIVGIHCLCSNAARIRRGRWLMARDRGLVGSGDCHMAEQPRSTDATV